VEFETKFIVLKGTDPIEPLIEPVSIRDWSSSARLLAGSTEAIVLQEIGDAIRASGIALEMVHAVRVSGGKVQDR
jgi:hypothetical protein